MRALLTGLIVAVSIGSLSVAGGGDRGVELAVTSHYVITPTSILLLWKQNIRRTNHSITGDFLDTGISICHN